MPLGRQFCTPHLLQDGLAKPLQRIPFEEKAFDEDTLQRMLFEHPSLLPIAEIEVLFDGLLPLARELVTNAGPVDLVYVNPDGYLTIVETKLWRNPEARRLVVAQIIDYASALAKWSYTDLDAAVKRTGAKGIDAAIDAVATTEGFDRARFVDTVTRSLRLGRFLLLIVGDGIREGVEQLTETLSLSPQLGFSLALVELALYRTEASPSGILVQPRTIARTREVTRAVVEIRAGVARDDVIVSLPSSDPELGGTKRPRVTEEVLIEELAKTTSRHVADAFAAFLRELDAIDVMPTARDASLSLFWYEPNTGKRFTFGSVTQDGQISTSYVLSNYRKIGIDESIGERYIVAIAGLVSGARIRTRPTRDGERFMNVVVGNRDVALADLLARSDDWVAAIRAAQVETEGAGASATSANT
jgi:hypothetical protein